MHYPQSVRHDYVSIYGLLARLARAVAAGSMLPLLALQDHMYLD